MPSPPDEMLALLAKLPSLPPPNGVDAIIALEHPGLGCMVGRTAAGRMCVLVPTAGPGSGRHLSLRNIEVRETVTCEVLALGGTTRVIKGTLVICRSEQSGLIRLFLGLVADAVAALGRRPAATAFANWVIRAAELFSRLEGEGRRTMQGLWAELVVAGALPSPEVAIRRWHADPMERYDFTSGAFSREVKSCADFDRVHLFTLAQMRPPPDVTVWIASVVARPDPLGRSVLDLVNALEARLPTSEVREKLREVVFASAGSSLDDDDRYRFDEVAGRESIRMLDASAVPSLSGPLAPEIVSVQLRVRCVGVPEAGGVRETADRLDGGVEN